MQTVHRSRECWTTGKELCMNYDKYVHGYSDLLDKMQQRTFAVRCKSITVEVFRREAKRCIRMNDLEPCFTFIVLH